MTFTHWLSHKLNLVRFEATGNVDADINGKKLIIYFFKCPVCNKLESVPYWYDEPLVNKRWWQ